MFRATASVVLVSFAWLTGGGYAWAEARAAEKAPARTLARLADDPRLPLSSAERDYLRTAAGTLSATPPTASASTAEAPATSPPLAEADPAAEMQDIANELDRLAATGGGESLAGLQGRWQRLHQRILDDFAQSEARLRAANVPDVILQRHAAAVADYAAEAGEVARELDAAGDGKAGVEARLAAQAAARRLRKSGNERPHQKLDPSHLPFRAAVPTLREPGAIAGPVDAMRPSAAEASAAAASLAGADLEPTEDAPITADIQALAASLGNQPLPIFNWVRNNIEFVPTYGSVQGASMTLDARRGNAFDTASLLIALLRAAGVQARYVTGTVEVPVSSVRNWVGGVASANEAQQLMGQGGIPTVGVISSGTVTQIRLDHVWVEAFIDYIPSRGAVHRVGDTWIPMDPSFKLHDFTPRSALFTDNPITTIVPPGTRLFDVDEALGRFTNINEEVLSDALQGWVARSDDYVVAHAVPRSVPSLIGGAAIRTETRTVFAATLPYRVLTRAPAVDVLPAGLRHYVRLNGYSSELDRAFGDTSFSVRLSLPALNTSRLGIQFDPATPADAAVLDAARSGGASSLPVYLVNVVPVVRLDGVDQATGPPVRMGSFFPVDVILEGPDGPTTVSYTQVAGDEIVVGVTGNGVTREVVEKRFVANPVDNAPEYFHQVQLHYWLECDTLGDIGARTLGVHVLRLPSVGLFNSPLSVSYFFGIPRSGVYQSRIMDVKHSLLGIASDDASKALAFFKQAGIQSSYLEGSVFDQLEGGSQPAIKGISAIHLISMAIKQGVPVYHVTSANAAAVLPLLALDGSVKSDITRAVGQGQNVIVPERNLTVGPWRGVGYIVRDEVTGAGGYLISGGLAGGGLIECFLRKLVPVFKFVLVVLFILLLAFLLALLLAALWEWLPALIPLLAAPATGPMGGAGPGGPALPATASAVAKEDIAALLLIARGLAPLGITNQ
ncbi:MAG TPA: transglutaminase-like domain-containing protein [Vicinamibacteria bacterium]